MTTREYLSQINKLNKMIENKAEEIQQLEDVATSITRQVSETGGVKTSGASDKVGNAVAVLIDLKGETEDLLEEYVAKRKLIIQQIDAITDANLYEVLTSRYVAGKEWYIIAGEMGYTIRNTMNVHRKALNEFEGRFGETYLNEN